MSIPTYFLGNDLTVKMTREASDLQFFVGGEEFLRQR